MKVLVGENGTLELSEVFNGISLKSTNGHKLFICCRNGGFEIKYKNKNYEAKQEGIVPTGKEPTAEPQERVVMGRDRAVRLINAYWDKDANWANNLNNEGLEMHLESYFGSKFHVIDGEPSVKTPPSEPSSSQKLCGNNISCGPSDFCRGGKCDEEGCYRDGEMYFKIMSYAKTGELIALGKSTTQGRYGFTVIAHSSSLYLGERILPKHDESKGTPVGVVLMVDVNKNIVSSNRREVIVKEWVYGKDK